MKTTKGKFIVIEGGEGSGKGTIIEHLKKVFGSKDVKFSREPGGTPLAEALRAHIMDGGMDTMTELLLFEAGRADHIAKVIAPSLRAGTHVICDRFDASTVAYQVRARWHGKHADIFEFVNGKVVGKATPDLYIFCDITPKKALQRRLSSGGEITRFDNEDLAFHEEVYRGYKAFLKTKRHVLIDSTRGIPEVCAVAEAIVRTELGF